MNKKILVLDDDLAILDVVKIILEEKKYQVSATSSVDIINTFSENAVPDIILLDISMNGTDGRVIAQNIRKQKLLSHVPIIFVSAHNETEKIAKEAGADGFLAKPFDIDKLVETIEKYTS